MMRSLNTYAQLQRSTTLPGAPGKGNIVVFPRGIRQSSGQVSYLLATDTGKNMRMIPVFPDKRYDTEIDGTNYHSILDSTETIHNTKYNIILFKEDKVMYLASSTPGETGTHPMQQMLAFLDSTHNSTCSFSRNKSQVKVLISFPSGGTCKQLSIILDTAAQRLISMEYIIRTSLLMDEQSQEDVPDKYEEYAFVKATFTGYRELKKNLRLFDEHNYFFKEGAEFKVAPAYKDYTIFVGSPGLQ